MASVFVTGLYRSGTTLLEKIISNHKDAKIASQPFPYLYFQLKNDYYTTLGITRRYPLDDLFLEDAYTDHDFLEFLQNKSYDRSELQRVFEDMKDYFGQWTPELKITNMNLSGGTLENIFRSIMIDFGRLFPHPLSVLGTKEILCEEFIPYFLSKDIKVLHIIRDPRDVLVSVSSERGQYYTGRVRPTLFTIRAWRKSVSYFCLCRANPQYKMIRFRDLVTDFGNVIQDIFRFLEISPQVLNESVIKDQFGRDWYGNSSFTARKGIDTTVIDGYLSKLDFDQKCYIEKLCYPELRLLGFTLDRKIEDIMEYDLSNYREPYLVERKEFAYNYSWDPKNLSDEVERLRILGSERSLTAMEVRRWFINQQAYDQLGEMMKYGY